MIHIDGSTGEGGGQILRSSLALSMVTGTPFSIEHIRAGRKKPGLMRQHLTAVQAATRISAADVRGDEIGSTTLAFTPAPVTGGNHVFSVGTAGSTTLVLQTVLLPLLLTEQPSRLQLEGGTHNPFAPPFDFLAQAYLPLLEKLGATVTATLDRPGFYPAGGGSIDITPAARLAPFDLLERGKLQSRRARAMVSRLPRHIAERELSLIQKKLSWPDDQLEVVEVGNSPGPGNIVTIALSYEHVTEVFTGFGEVGRPAEAVAQHALQQCRKYMKATAPVGEYLTDQLMLPMAVAGDGAFYSTGLSRHAQTHLELISRFLHVPITQKPHEDGGVVLRFG